MRIIFIISFCIFSGQASCQIDSGGKRYNFTHPLPRTLLKEMETDRPDATESAYTVAAGHFQLETDMFKQVRNKDQQFLNVESSFNLVNLKLGLTRRTDVQVVIPTYVTSRVKERATRKITENQHGFGDIIIRYKYNLWGYSGGKTALALLPFLLLPTAASGSTGLQGGIIIPFAWDISNKVSFGSQVGFARAKEDDNAYHNSYLCSFTFGRSVGRKVDVFSEMLFNYNHYQARFDTYANGGIILSLTGNLNLDAGFNYGLKATSYRTFFTGISFRL